MDKTVSALVIIVLCFGAALSAAWILEKPGAGDEPASGIPTVMSTPVQSMNAPTTSSSSGSTARCTITITRTEKK